MGKNPAIFDFEKLTWLNGQHIRCALPERIIDLCESLLIDAYGTHDVAYIGRVVRLLLDRLRLIPDIVPLSLYFFKDEYEFDEKAQKNLKAEGAGKILETLSTRLAQTEPFVKEEIEKVFKGLATELNLKLGMIIHPCRAAVSGRAETPSMYEVLEVLGKEKVLKRIKAALTA